MEPERRFKSRYSGRIGILVKIKKGKSKHLPELVYLRFSNGDITPFVWSDLEEIEPKIFDPNTPQGKKIKVLFNFYRHIHDKNADYTLDSARETKIRARLSRNEKRRLGQCAQAIIGMLFSNFHQGENNNNKVYDDIRIVFKDAYNFERFVNEARTNGVTEEIALQELQGFVNGKPSRYTKRQSKPAQTAQNGSQPNGVGANSTTDKQYRAFAHSIVNFFFTGVENKDLLELCDSNPSLKTEGAGLTDARFLAESLLDAGKVYKQGGIPADKEAAMRDFSETFCELQQYN